MADKITAEPSPITQKLFCFGLGYCATTLIEQLRQSDSHWHFAGTRRRLPEAPDREVEVFAYDGTGPFPDFRERLSDVTHLLLSIAPDAKRGDLILHHHAADIAKLKNLEWIGYLSTTGVYGDRQGGWVKDDTAPAPTSPRGQQRWQAEQDWLRLYEYHDLPVHIFRLGGIYGPGRGQLHSLLEGKARKIIKQGQYFSRIHVADIAGILMASLRSPNPGQSYNVVDDLPTSSAEVIDYLCDLLHRPHLPPLDIRDAEPSPLMKSFYGENKRVGNSRIKQELGVALKYPTYKEGFKALIDASDPL